MNKRKIFFRADAGASIGYGHFIRTLALADMLKDNFDCTFFTTSPTAYQIGEMEKVCKYISLREETKFNDFLSLLQGDEIVVLDNYFYTSEYQLQIKQKGCRLVCIDDMHDKHYYADVVINHGLTDSSLFDIESYTRLCLGLDYALLRKPFLTPNNIKKEEGRWFISLGGSDWLNLAEKFLALIHDDERVKKITVVIGDAYKYKENLSKYPKATIKKNLPAEQMAREMRLSQYAILSSSSVCIEALACGCKIASGYFIDNQAEFASVIKDRSLVQGLGNLIEFTGRNLVDQTISFEYNIPGAFCSIRDRYINTFNTL